MRDTDRIEPFLKELGDLWKENCSDWRFGQLMYNFFSECGDPFYWEEDYFIKKIRDYFNKAK